MKNIINQLRKPENLKKLAVAMAVFLILAAGLFVLKTEARIEIENSQIVAPVITISSTQPGKLKNILVAEGQKVKKGDSLAIVGSEILRPFTDGVVVETNKQIGSLVTAQVPVIKIADINNMRVDGIIDENKGLKNIKIGQVASFTVDAYPGRTYWGYVDEVAESARQTQLSFSISSERPVQQFDVYIRFDAASYPEIKNGMSAKTTIFIK